MYVVNSYFWDIGFLVSYLLCIIYFNFISWCPKLSGICWFWPIW